MRQFKGTPASLGISKGKAFVLKESDVKITNKKITSPEKEINFFLDSLKKVEEQIKKIQQEAVKNLGEEKAAIFLAHLDILNDPTIIEETTNLIKNENINAAHSYNESTKKFIDLFSSMEDEYMRERVADIKDVSKRVINMLLKIETMDLNMINEETIIIAHDLTPSQTSQLNPKFVKGFITEIGGKTSHSAIMARTLEIPAIVGVGKEIFEIENKTEILMDGESGSFYTEPTSKLISELQQKTEILRLANLENQKFIGKKSISKDGWKTEIVANIGSPNDVEQVLKNDSDGIGLFRTEFLYMESENWPTEKEQYEAYKVVLEKSNPKKVVIRTLDIGGDKVLKYYKFPYEMNPFLGYRAVRLQLDQKDILKTQIRALLRASKFGKLAINVPMIATIEEFIAFKKEVKLIEKELKKEGHAIKKYELGIMVEVPSTVEMMDKFVKYADFFSIGTNDLIQYTFAADRMSEKVSYLYQPFNPAILRKIKKVIDESHKANKWTAICGEMASEKLLAPIFVGMGLDEFSMSATAILPLRKLISKINKKKAEKLVKIVLNLETEVEVKKEIIAFLEKEKISLN